MEEGWESVLFLAQEYFGPILFLVSVGITFAWFLFFVVALARKRRPTKALPRTGLRTGRWAFALGMASLIFVMVRIISGIGEHGRVGILFFCSVPGFPEPEIYVMNTDGTGHRRLTRNPGWDDAPAWSPDGEKIAFSSSGHLCRDICLMNPDGTGQTKLTGSDTLNYEPAWSPDGRKIAFTRIVSGSGLSGAHDIFIMDSDGSAEGNLTNSPDEEEEPDWSPDGNRIVFAKHEGFPDGVPNVITEEMLAKDGLYLINADGSGLTQLTRSDSCSDSEPSWSPDGRRIAFTGRCEGDSQIYVMNADGSQQTNLTNNEGYNYGPAWSADGAKISFVSKDDGNWWLYVMNADGSEQTKLTRMPAFYMNMAWSPDGHKIAYTKIPSMVPEIVLSTFTILFCGILGPLAFWLGIRSRRYGEVRTIALVGLVSGAISTLVFAVALVMFPFAPVFGVVAPP